MSTIALCAHCGSSISISRWTLIPSKPIERIICQTCGRTNYLSIRTLVCFLIPLVITAFAFAFAAKALGLSDGQIAILSIFSVVPGSLFGFWLAQRNISLRNPWQLGNEP